MENEKNEEKKAHIFEIDFLRALTVFSVVTIHSISSTSYLYSKSHAATNILSILVHLLHYNRETFVFVTGVVLTYVYFHRKFSAVKFWGKRLLVILIPYILWSIIYTYVDNPTTHGSKLISLSWTNILTGNASYQLYYILLALQFYVLFPFFLWFIKRVYKHPFTVLAISFILQIVFIYFDFTYLQKGPLTQLPIVKNFLTLYQDRLFITYQFFFFFGSIVAIYMNNSYQYLRKYGKYLPAIFIITIVCYAFYFFYQLHSKESLSYATSVLQPSVVIYSTVIIFFFSWLAILWAKEKRLFKFIKTISDASFGIFFVHVMILNYLVQHLLPMLSSTVPAWGEIIVIVLSTFALSLILCLILIRIPFLSWTIGRVGRTK